MAWGRKTGGRKRGTPNKKASVLAAQAEAVVAVAGGEEPIQYMLRIMNDPTVEHSRRDAKTQLRPGLGTCFHSNSRRNLVNCDNLSVGNGPAACYVFINDG